MVSKGAALHEQEGPAQPASVSLQDAYARYVPYVAKLGLRLLGRPDEVDDLIQDVFVIATERFGELRDPGALRGWLSAVTVRTAVRRLRRRRVRRLIMGGSHEQAVSLAPYLSGASAEQHRLLVEVFEVLDRAPVKDRVAWSLRILEEEPLERVAELCNCSLATAKRRIAAAQELVERALGR